MPNLSTLFMEVAIPSGQSSASGLYLGTSIPDTPHHLARDSRGKPVVLLAADESDIRPASLQLQNFQIEHGIRCRIAQASGNTVENKFTVAQCRADDVLLQRCFLDLFDVVLAELPLQPTQRDVSQTLQRMASLFLTLERPPRRAAQGLWGELLLIVRATNPIRMAESWHNEASERFDFASGSQRLEVKTSAERSRCHHFSYEQAYPVQGVQCVVASMFLEQSTGGRSLGDLWDEVRNILSAQLDLRVRIDEVCLSSLGNTWQQACSLAFDEQLAVASLAFFDVRDIPRLQQEVPNGISEIRFRSDLSLATRIQNTDRDTAPLAVCLLPTT